MRHYADERLGRATDAGAQTAATALRDILATPISPELLPTAADGDIAQKTEDQIGTICLSPRGDWRMPSDLRTL